MRWNEKPLLDCFGERTNSECGNFRVDKTTEGYIPQSAVVLSSEVLQGVKVTHRQWTALPPELTLDAAKSALGTDICWLQ